jgi:hypothetical protein
MQGRIPAILIPHSRRCSAKWKFLRHRSQTTAGVQYFDADGEYLGAWSVEWVSTQYAKPRRDRGGGEGTVWLISPYIPLMHFTATGALIASSAVCSGIAVGNRKWA